MIQPLRQLHARVFLVLGIALPVLFVGGIASRQSLPKARAARTEIGGLTPVAQQAMQVNGSSVRLNTFRNREGIVLQVSSSNTLNAPDVLVYASATEPKDALTDDATFLGEYAPEKLYRLPAEGSRFVVLYSLGYQQVLASFPLAGQP
jgi:hypothetical protein